MATKHFKKKYTTHAKIRAEQRGVDITKAKSAKRYGINHKDVLLALGFGSPLEDYIFKRTAKRDKKVKIYKHNVFVFFRTSDRCITCYPLPEELEEEYEKVRHMEDDKKKQFEKRKRD